MYNNKNFIMNNKYAIIKACNNAEISDMLLDRIANKVVNNEAELAKYTAQLLADNNIDNLHIIVDYVDLDYMNDKFLESAFCRD